MSQEAKVELALLLARAATKPTKFDFLRDSLLDGLKVYSPFRDEAAVLKYYIDQATVDGPN